MRAGDAVRDEADRLAVVRPLQLLEAVEHAPPDLVERLAAGAGDEMRRVEPGLMLLGEARGHLRPGEPLPVAEAASP